MFKIINNDDIQVIRFLHSLNYKEHDVVYLIYMQHRNSIKNEKLIVSLIKEVNLVWKGGYKNECNRPKSKNIK